MAVPVITPLPPAPVRSDAPADFSSKADAFVAALQGFGSQANDLAVFVNDKATETYEDASAAALDRAETYGYKLDSESAKNDAQTAASQAIGVAAGVEADRIAAQAAASSASDDAQRAEDAADRAEAIVGPVGTAVSRDAQTSPFDTTPGRLMEVGAFGWGASNAGLDVADPDAINYTTVFRAYNRASMPSLSTFAGINILRDGVTGRAFQIAGEDATQEMHFRFRTSANVWQPWETVCTMSAWFKGQDRVETASVSGTKVVNLNNYSIFDYTLSGATTLTPTLPTLDANGVRSVVVRIRQGATAHTLTWWPGISWLALTTPAAPAANKVAEYVLEYSAAGWIGRPGAKN